MKYEFDFYSPENFQDVNSDGYKDFLITSYGSTAENTGTGFYLFNNKKKRFIFSKELSLGYIIRIDSIGKKLITSSFSRDFSITNTHYFDKFGKEKFLEVITEYSSPFEYKTYEKIIKGKIVETKTDSIISGQN